MSEIRHGTHWGAWQCLRLPAGMCDDCKAFRRVYQQELRAEKREQRRRRTAARLAAERQHRGEAA
jgi:hypothetical protein